MKKFRLTKKFKDQYEKIWGIRPNHGVMSSDKAWNKYLKLVTGTFEPKQ